MQSLLFIPDISGFTRFVNETESVHGRHIIAELLELLIDSNTLDLTVSEIEGDAIMFYTGSRVPSVAEIVDQAEKMFVSFHAHLKAYETRRICQCGACTSAGGLTLKIVAHTGPIEFLRVKDFLKPFGSNMILVHRLLKNDIPESEYVLLTEALFEAESSPLHLPSWVRFTRGEATYEEAGTVAFRYTSLSQLHERVPAPGRIDDFQKTSNPVVGAVHIENSAARIYELISDLSLRLKWNDQPSRLDFKEDRVNRVGTSHQCVVRGDLLHFETVRADFGRQNLVYGERLQDPPFVRELAVFYILSPDGSGTNLRIEMHYRPHPFPRSLLVPLFRVISRVGIRRQLTGIREALSEDRRQNS